MQPTEGQQKLLSLPTDEAIFLQGPAGSGKTTAGTLWLQRLMGQGIPAHEILVFVPQRTLGLPYQQALRGSGDLAHGLVDVLTLGGLARRMVDLFWPLVSEASGVGNPSHPPHFLTLETAQYYMAHIVQPLIENQGFFESLTLNRNRIYSQILDNLNKAAIVGFPVEEIAPRLKSAWVGDIEQLNIYEDVQQCANAFRAFCLDHNLLDFSLQVEIFSHYLWPSRLCRSYLTRTYRHLIVDNVEEDTPVSHDILREWLPDFDSALVIFDQNAGYRFFLGADVQSAFALRKQCGQQIVFPENRINGPGIRHLKTGIRNALSALTGEGESQPQPVYAEIMTALGIPEENLRYFPGMVAWVVDRIEKLLEEGLPPGEIVILAPFMPDVLRFSLTSQMTERGIPFQSHRPSRALRDEPATHTLLTLARTAFPDWDMLPDRITLAYALTQVIEGLDLVRSQLLTDHVYQRQGNASPLGAFETLPAEIRERVTYTVGEHYEQLRTWLAAASAEDSRTLDFFLNRLFGEVLSQPGFRFHGDLDSGNIIATLIESIQKFRWSTNRRFADDRDALGREYVRMVENGVIAAQYVQSWQRRDRKAVFLAPAYTFLISNQPVDIQFWLDIGSPSWYQRLEQPLTQPYVLSRHWPEDARWTAEDEMAASLETLERLILGLLNRCRKKIFLGMSEYDVSGYENRGLLIRILQQALQSARREA
jgi:hypothetical protein